MRPVFILALGVIIGSTLSSMVALAWTGPTASPPNNNVNGVIVTVGDQIINGILSLNGTVIYGNTLLSGTNRYINFGSTSGSSGYGIRDNAGVLEFKSSGGSWGSLNTALISLLTLNGITVDGLGNVTGIRFPNGTQTASSTAQTTAGCSDIGYINTYGSLPAASTYYIGVFRSDSETQNEQDYTVLMPRAGTAQSLYVRLQPGATPQPSSGNLVFTLRKNGADTPLSATVPAGSTAGYIARDTTHSVPYAAGDELDIKIVNNASGWSVDMH